MTTASGGVVGAGGMGGRPARPWAVPAAKPPAVSVVVPTWGHGSLVLETLSSVFAQSFADHEVIVVNDGSLDDTAAVLRPLAAAGRIRYLEQANAGQAAARNAGIAQARGTYVALLDDDDLWPPDKLRWQVAALEGDPAAVAVGGGALLIDAAGRRTGASPVVDAVVTPESLFANGSPFRSPGQTLIRAAVLRAAGGLRHGMPGADDFDLWFRLSRRGRVRADSRTALLYRLHAGNASNRTDRMFRSTAKVLRRHLPSVPANRRSAAERAAAWWLYWYLGQGLVRRARDQAADGRLAVAARTAFAATAFGGPMLRDLRLCRQVLSDLLPDPLRDRIRLAARSRT